jgi:hypothetical protein
LEFCCSSAIPYRPANGFPTDADFNWRLGGEGLELCPAVNGLTGRYATNVDFNNRGLALLRRHFVCDRRPLTHRRNFFSDGIQSGELERRFVTGARPIERVDFQSRTFW